LEGSPDLKNYAISTATEIEWDISGDSYMNEDKLAFAYSLFYVYYDQYDYIRGIAV
jgi:hypothetical protein